MKNIGIITFHAAYNYGSVLQAQATQLAIEKLGYHSEIIDYRPSTYDHYDRIYCERGHTGKKGKLLTFLLKIRKKKRNKRIRLFETYMAANMKTSSTRFFHFSDLSRAKKDYDIFLSGSDQIWSKMVPEIMLAGNDTVLGYFLAFTDRKKVSYASSVASMNEQDLTEYKTYLEQYEALSTREQIGLERLERVIEKDIELVLDPTFLLTAQEWRQFAMDERIVKEPYVLLYSLRNHKAQKFWMMGLKKFAKQNSLKIVVLAPYFEMPVTGAVNMLASGPAEFLNLYANATVVCTDTFHGTAFAVNFNKPFYSLGAKYWKEDIRKTALLKLLGLESRIINDEIEMADFVNYDCDFTNANRILSKERKRSISYLKNVLSSNEYA